MPPSSRQHAFTLIELLVVIAVIGVLAGMALPVFSSIQEKSRETKCANNLHGLGAAFLLFAGEHDNQLPGSYDTRSAGVNNPDLAYQGSWLSGSNAASSETTNVPRNGTIYPYMGSNDAAYRCPSLHLTRLGSGAGSNGLFDYVFFCRLAGARLQNIPPKARMRGNFYPLPMLIEEDPAVSLNASTSPIEGIFDNLDQAAQTHHQGCNYVATDGSVQRLATPVKANPILAQEWEAVISSNSYLNLGKPNVTSYGQWLDGGTVTSQ